MVSDRRDGKDTGRAMSRKGGEGVSDAPFRLRKPYFIMMWGIKIVWHLTCVFNASKAADRGVDCDSSKYRAW